MRQGLIKGAALAGAAILLAGCVGTQDVYRLPPTPQPNFALQTPPRPAPEQIPLQCVPYARDHSNVKLYGDAWTWWDQAAGKFPREAAPQFGAVMVLANYAGPERGHVAVVRTLISPREIRVDHANWLGDGAVTLDDPVWDVSANNDWSAVKVWNGKTGAWGVKIYPVQGFIGPGEGAMDRQDDHAMPQTPDQIALLNLIRSQ
jgi:hypothetical protein